MILSMCDHCVVEQYELWTPILNNVSIWTDSDRCLMMSSGRSTTVNFVSSSSHSFEMIIWRRSISVCWLATAYWTNWKWLVRSINTNIAIYFKISWSQCRRLRWCVHWFWSCQFRRVCQFCQLKLYQTVCCFSRRGAHEENTIDDWRNTNSTKCGAENKCDLQ